MLKHIDGNLILLLFIVLCISAQEDEDEKKSKIIDGIKSRMGQFPFLVSIMRKAEFGQRCGGCVLNRWFVFTACHCVADVWETYSKPYELSWLFVVAGHVNRLPGKGGQVRFIDAAIITEKCKRVFPGATHDVALIKITHPFRWTPFLKPMPIYSKDPEVIQKRIDHLMAINAECFGVGWGMTQSIDLSKYNTPSDVLLYAKVRMMELHHCGSLMPSELMERKQICALGYDDSDVCQADSGGPLICLGHVYAIVSWGPFCGEFNMSTMYQRLDTDIRLISSSTPQKFSLILILFANKITHMFFI